MENFKDKNLIDEIEEAKKIKEKYSEKSESQIEQLIKLDKMIESPCFLKSLTFGIIASLILGAGMSFCLIWKSTFMLSGILIGLLGIAIMILNPIIYKNDLANRRNKFKSKIINLADEVIG